MGYLWLSWTNGVSVRRSSPRGTIMNNTTDTNQASEDELTLEKLLKFLCGEEPISGRWFGEKYEGEPAFWWRPELKRLIRTEKLKLLAEVRERVVGSRDDEEKYSDLSKYKQRKVIIEYEQRVKQLAEINKLEAEL